MPRDARSLPNSAQSMTSIERQTLERIFKNSLPHNLAWGEVVALFDAIGTVEYAHNDSVVFHMGNDHLTFVMSHNKSLEVDDMVDLRHFLTRSGWMPSSALGSAS